MLSKTNRFSLVVVGTLCSYATTLSVTTIVGVPTGVISPSNITIRTKLELPTLATFNADDSCVFDSPFNELASITNASNPVKASIKSSVELMREVIAEPKLETASRLDFVPLANKAKLLAVMT